MSDKVYVGSRVSSLEVGEPFEPISRVTFHVDDEHYYTAGDDTGRHLEYDMPWATQEMVDNALKSLKGFVYKPFQAKDAMIDPAAELGDGVTVGGEYFMLAQMTTRFDAKCASDIGAPGEREMDHEYPYLDPVQRELKRRVKLGQKYYGTTITRQKGLVIEQKQENTDNVLATAVFNADQLAFYKGTEKGGEPVLYFDAAAGKFRFVGDVNITSGSIDINKKFHVDKDGNVTLAGSIKLSDGAITWGANAPTKKQFSKDGKEPWHDQMQPDDRYRRDWDYAKDDWGPVYQFKGKDGVNGKDGADGSDATVPKYITQTIISKGVIEAPRINANVFGVYPSSDSDTNGAFVLHAPVAGQTPEVFKIAYNGTGGTSPTVIITSGGCSHVFWSCDAMLEMESDIIFRGDVDFSLAGKVTGLHATFA